MVDYYVCMWIFYFISANFMTDFIFEAWAVVSWILCYLRETNFLDSGTIEKIENEQELGGKTAI